MKRRIFYLFIAFILALNVFQAPVSEAQSVGGPILVVYNTAGDGKFGPYLGEILHAEGLNSFNMAAIDVMNAGLLAQYQVVILGKTSLTAGQAADLTAFVNGGGRLIAMQPDTQIYPVLGLTGLAGQQADGYIKLNNSAMLNGQTPGTGLSSETLQLHGSGEKYTTAVGAVVLAELYTDAVTQTGYPAVVGKSSGTGWGVAYAYDLPANIIFTRQGNPANADQDMDGDTYIRTVDLFQGTPSWLDLDKVPVPQADEQQRFLGRLVKSLTSMPLPQLWYFPGTTRTMLIITSDTHAEPSAYYESLMTSLNTYGAHDTFYLSQAGDPLPTDVATWITAGNSFGIHPYPFKADYAITNLTEGYTKFNDWFLLRFPGVQRSLTVRHHTVGWQGWTEAVDIESAFGMRMDTNFYHWGPWLQKTDDSWAHGFITGSGLPMKFAAEDGTILPVYQQATQLVDEHLNAGIYDPGYVEGLPAQGAYQVTQALIDASQGGYYAALTTQFHVGYYHNFPNVAEWADSTMAYAQSLNIPMWNADEWLAFTEARDATTYQNLAWNPVTGVITFSLDAANSQSSTLLPVTYDGYELVGVKVDNVAQPFQQVTINGVPMAFVPVPAGLHAYSARYHAEADLSISMTGDPVSVVAGNQITYSIVVNNSGPDGAQNVTVSDALPAGTSFASVTTDQGTCSGTVTVLCDLGDIPVGSPVTISLVVNVDPARRTQVENLATVNSLSNDVNLPNNTATAATQVTAKADVGITLIDSPDPVIAGNNIVYTISVANSGPSTATGIVATIDLDAGVNYQEYSGANWSCVEGPLGTITCSHSGSLNVGDNVSVDITGTVNAGQTSNLAANASVVSTEVDDNPTNANASATTTVQRSADMGIILNGAPASVTAGNNLVYTLTATNYGLSTATGINSTIILDSGVGYQEYNGVNWACTEGTPGVVTCTYTGTLNAGASTSANVTVKVSAGQVAGLSSTASVAAAEADGNPANNSAIAINSVIRSADMEIGLSAPLSITAGNSLVYTLATTNHGLSTATGISATLILDAGVSYQTFSGTNWACVEGTPGTVTCTYTGTMLVNASSSVTVTVDVAPGQLSGLISTASIAANETDNSTQNNNASANTAVNRNADMGITLSAPSPVIAGNNLVYALSATNYGPSTATGVTATLSLDSGVSYLSSSGTNWLCSEGTPGTLNCTYGATLNVNASASLNVTVIVAAGQVSGLTSSASVDDNEADGNSNNNNANTNTAVTRRADLGITFSGAPPTVTAGNNLVYTLTATNYGPSTATGITATVNLDSGVSYQSSIGTNWSCSEAPLGKVTCTYSGILNAGASSSATVTVKVAAGQVTGLSSTASVDAVETDGNLANDNASANTIVNRSADMGIVLSAPSPVTAGTSLVYTLTTTNHGPSTATGVNATLTLDSGTSFLTFSGTNWNCVEGTPVKVDCVYTGTLNVNASPSVTVTVDVAASQVAALSSSADVGAIEADSNSGNNGAIATTTVIRRADMSISMSGAPTTVIAGNNLVYSLVATNLGPSTATSISATIHLDSGVSYQTFSGSNWACSEGTPPTVICTFSGTLDVAASASVDVTVKVAAGQVSVLSSSGDVDASETDNNSGNDNADTSTAVDRKADIDLTLSDLPDAVIAGNNLVYTLGVHNSGPSTSTGIQVVLHLDAGVSYQGFSGSGWSCSEATGTVTCSFSSTLNVQGSNSVDVTVKVDPAQHDALSSDGVLSGSEMDPDDSNNQASAGTSVNRLADVSLTVVDSPDPIAVGQDLTYSLTIQNTGPSSAESPSITNILPAGVTYKGYEGLGWTCLENAGTVTCGHGELLPGFTGTVQIVVTTPNEPVSLEFTASVTSVTPDGDPNNNEATVTTEVTPSVDLSVNLSANEDPARAGHLFEYTLTVANLGLSTANSVEVKVSLPLGSEFVSALGTGWICNYSSGSVTCTLAQLPVGPASPIAILLRVPMSGLSITTKAVVQSTSGDPVIANNTAELTTSIEYVQYIPVLFQTP